MIFRELFHKRCPENSFFLHSGYQLLQKMPAKILFSASRGSFTPKMPGKLLIPAPRESFSPNDSHLLFFKLCQSC
jgi:hypothetical protein